MSNIKLLENDAGLVKYPEKEKAYALINPEKIPFSMAIVGITMPSPGYKILRSKNANITVFEYIVSGEGRLFIDGQWHKAEAGDLYILRQGEEHRYEADPKNPWKKIWVNYSAEYIPALLTSYGVESGVYHGAGVRSVFDELVNLVKSQEDTIDIAFRLADRIYSVIKSASRAKLEAISDEYGMLRHLGSYVYRKFNLNELADELHMSKSNVIRIFKKKYGVPPYGYLLDMKMEAAKALLRDTDLPIKKIADKLCISDEHYFSTLFTRRVGMRPGAYRAERDK
ncbi:MAG: AraC family transcriptional regulator [Ruminococcaceae bacterium]|nr:AraC family transcriptional regulator [Oscillospiraceae bacterium]